MYYGEPQVKWIRTWFESLAIVFMILLIIGGVFAYLLYASGDKGGLQSSFAGARATSPFHEARQYFSLQRVRLRFFTKETGPTCSSWEL